MKKIMVTGGEGFIGRHLTESLRKKHNVATYDIKSSKDIRDYESLERALAGVGVVYHLAAQVSVARSIENPDETFQTNIFGSTNVINAAIEREVGRIVFSSSCAVYGESSKNPKTEDMPLHSKSPYAASKITVENALKSFSNSLDYVVLRYFNVYGPGQDPNSQYAAVIPLFIQRALKDQDIVIHGNGKQTRDFIFIDDVVDANIRAMKKGEGEVFNVGSGKETSVNELAELIIGLTNSKSKLVYAKQRDGDIDKSLAVISKARRILNFEPKYDLERGLKETIAWFRKTANK